MTPFKTAKIQRVKYIYFIELMLCYIPTCMQSDAIKGTRNRMYNHWLIWITDQIHFNSHTIIMNLNWKKNRCQNLLTVDELLNLSTIRRAGVIVGMWTYNVESLVGINNRPGITHSNSHARLYWIVHRGEKKTKIDISHLYEYDE